MLDLWDKNHISPGNFQDFPRPRPFCFQVSAPAWTIGCMPCRSLKRHSCGASQLVVAVRQWSGYCRVCFCGDLHVLWVTSFILLLEMQLSAQIPTSCGSNSMSHWCRWNTHMVAGGINPSPCCQPLPPCWSNPYSRRFNLPFWPFSLLNFSVFQQHLRNNWLVVWNIFYFPIYWE